MASYSVPSSSSTSTLCIFCCYSFYPPKSPQGGLARTKQSLVFNNFLTELELNLTAGYSLGDHVCQDCFKNVESIINSKRRASVVEDKVRRLSNEILMAVQDLDKCLERFEKDLKGVEGTVKNSDLACLQSYVEDGTYSEDVFVVREKIQDVVRDVGSFKKDFHLKIYSELKRLDVSASLKLKPNQRSTFAQAASQVISPTAFQAPAAGPPPPSSTRVPSVVPSLAKQPGFQKLKPGTGIRQGQTVIRVIAASSNGSAPALPKKTPGPGPPAPRSRPGPASSKIKSHGQDEYKCRQCRQPFPTMDSMKEHEMSTHRLYQCSWCQKSFTNSGNVKAHERLHTGERPYKCADCPKSFKQQGGLSYHLRANPGHSALKMGQSRSRSSSVTTNTPGGSKKRNRRPPQNGATSVGDSIAEIVGGMEEGDDGELGVESEWEDVVMKMDPDDVEVEVDGFQNYLGEGEGEMEEEGANGDYFMEDYGERVEGGGGGGVGVDDPLADIQWM